MPRSCRWLGCNDTGGGEDGASGGDGQAGESATKRRLLGNVVGVQAAVSSTISTGTVQLEMNFS